MGIKFLSNQLWALIFLSLNYSQNLSQQELLFEKILNSSSTQIGYSIVQFTDGGFGISGERKVGDNSKMWTARLSERGELLWENLEGFHHRNKGIDVLDTQDGGLIAGGFESFLTRFKDKYQRPIYYKRASIFAYGSGGEKLWHHKIGGGLHDGVNGIFPIGEDLYQVIATVNSNIGLIRINKDGQIIKLKEMIREGHATTLSAVTQHNSETFACVAYLKDLEADETVQKILVFDLEGEIFKEINIPKNIDIKVQALGYHEHKNLLLAGYSGKDLAGSRARLIRYSDEIGFTDIIHEKAHSAFHSIGFLLDKRIVLGGFKKQEDGRSKQGIIQALDGNLRKEFEMAYGSSGPDSFYALLPCWNGGIILSGERSMSINSSGLEPRSWIIRTDRDGRSLKKIQEQAVLKARQSWDKESLKEFLQHNRSSSLFSLAKYYYQELNSYDLALQTNDPQKLVQFAISFPKSTLRNGVLEIILGQALGAENALILLGFALQFPETTQAWRAFEKISELAWQRLSNSEDPLLFQRFIRSYPLSVKFGEAFEKLEKLEFANLIDQVKTKKRSLEELVFRTVEQGSLALKHKDFDEAYRKMSLVLESEPFLQVPLASNPMRIEELTMAKEKYFALKESRFQTRSLWDDLKNPGQNVGSESLRGKQRQDLLFWQIKTFLDQFKDRKLQLNDKRQANWRKVNGLSFEGLCEKSFEALCLKANQGLSGHLPLN